MKLNREWHLSHPMPKNPTLEQRIQWHLEHLRNCSCRTDLPPKLKAEMKKRNIKITHWFPSFTCLAQIIFCDHLPFYFQIKKMKTIIAAVDFSPVSMNAAHYAADLAVRLKADLLVVNVVETPVGFGEVPPLASSIDQMINDSERELSAIKDHLVKYVGNKINVDITVPVGTVAYSLEAEVEREKACCIVMGTDSLTPAEHLLIRNHALATIHSVSVPVLIVPNGSSFTTIRKIVLAANLEDLENIPTLDLLREWLKIFKANLDIVSVIKSDEPKPKMVAGSHALQHKFAEFHPEIHFIYEDEVKKGIEKYIDKNRPGLLVTMPGNYSFMHGLFHKSQSRHLIRDPHIPVLSIS
jgi:nucleotide-binding universal stress UspA family protein